MSRSGPLVGGDTGLRLRQGQQLVALCLQEQLHTEQIRRDLAGLVRCDEIAPGHSPALPWAMQAGLVVNHTIVVGLVVFGLAVEAGGHVVARISELAVLYFT